tara:strand:- start:553 stop:981 length:429 start_codon:yes stop_codon:yes gene_type:complete
MNKFDTAVGQVLNEGTSSKVLQDIANLSSGTIGTLTGLSKFYELDRVQDAFYAFAKNSKKNYKTWSDAWNDWGAWYPEVQNWNLKQDNDKAEYTTPKHTVVVDKQDKSWVLYKGNSDDITDSGEVNPAAIKAVLRGVKQLYK